MSPGPEGRAAACAHRGRSGPAGGSSRVPATSPGRDLLPGREPEPPPGQAADLAGEAARDFTAVPTFEATAWTRMWNGSSAALRLAGVSEVVAVDLTREEFAIPVVRVIVPGPGRADHNRPVVPPRPAGHGWS